MYIKKILREGKVRSDSTERKGTKWLDHKGEACQKAMILFFTVKRIASGQVAIARPAKAGNYLV